MDNKPVQQPQNTTPQEVRKTISTVIAIVVLVALVAFDIFSTINYLSKPNNYLLFAMFLSYVATASTAVCTWLIRNGQVNGGTWGLIVTNLIALFLSPFLGSGLGLAYGVTAIVVTFVMSRGLEPKQAQRAIILGTGFGIATVVLDRLLPASNTTTASANNPFTYIILAILVVALIFVAIRQAWSGNIRIKIVTSFTFIALISVAVVGTVVYFSYRNQIRQDIRQRLLNVISITALQQNGDLFETIQTTADMQGTAYQKMQAVNHAILATDRDLAYVFSVRLDEQGKMTFVVDSGLEEGYDPVDVGVVYEDPSDFFKQNALTLDHPIVEPAFYTDIYGTFLSAYAPIYNSKGARVGIVGVDIFADKVLAQERAVLLLILGTTLGTMLLVTLLGLWLGNLFAGPIINLSAVAKKITDGDLGARAKVETTDEIGELATDFNLMTSQLQETQQGLEQRIADRTRNLELAANVGRAVSQVRALDIMLRDACELILKEFNLYYVQVYLTDASGSNLKLEAGTGSVGSQLIGRGHSLPLDTSSINGRAAVEKRSVVIASTAQSATFKQNPLLPETRGEMAVPLIVADRVVGVLDMQASQPGALTEEVLPAFEALAGQMAVAVQNANLLAETEQARAQVEAQARRLVRTGWSEHLDAIHKPEQLGFAFDHNTITPLADVDETQLPENGNAITAPITVTGESLGSLVVELADEARAGQTSELVNIVARQVAQQIENLRLLESAERYRAESERAARLQTVEGWQEYVASRTTNDLGYLYDTKEVRPQSDGQGEDISMFALPLKVRDEMIGKLAIQGLSNEDQESVDLANVVAERLSAHIESLRLFEETRRGQVELDKRARQLSTVAEISTASSRELDIDKLLHTVVHLTQRQFGLYHAHVFLFNQDTMSLKIAACGWKEGDPHEGTDGTAVIPMAQEQSLVARAARTQQVVTVNDVHNEPSWLPNPVLPDTQAEMAIPLVVGDQLLGVLDVQSDHLNTFTEEDAAIYATLATQVATALQNARSFTQAQKQAEREAMLNVINQKIQSATSVEAVLQIAARELGHALGAPMTVAQLSMKDNS